jgi:hypothetical protein
MFSDFVKQEGLAIHQEQQVVKQEVVTCYLNLLRLGRQCEVKARPWDSHSNFPQSSSVLCPDQSIEKEIPATDKV